MPRCLRCGAGAEWIEGNVPPADRRAVVEEAKRRIRECPGQPIVQGGPDGELVEINRVIYVSDADAALDSMLEEKP